MHINDYVSKQEMKDKYMCISFPVMNDNDACRWTGYGFTPV